MNSTRGENTFHKKDFFASVVLGTDKNAFRCERDTQLLTSLRATSQLVLHDMDVLLGKVGWIVEIFGCWLVENGRTPLGHRAFARKTFFLHPFEPSDCHELRSNRHHVCCWVRDGRQLLR